MEIQGVVKAILPQETGIGKKSGTPWARQSYVIETGDSQYKRHCCFSVFGMDKIMQYNIHVGDTINVFIDIDANEWNGKWYNQINAYRVDKINSNVTTAQTKAEPNVAPSATMQQSQTQSTKNNSVSSTSVNDESSALGDDDFPF